MNQGGESIMAAKLNRTHADVPSGPETALGQQPWDGQDQPSHRPTAQGSVTPLRRNDEDRNGLSEIGLKIFLDRYALKDVTRTSLTVGDTVVVVVDTKTGQREIGTVRAMASGTVTVELLDGTVVERAAEQVDKPIEVRPEQMMERVARGIAAVEAPEKRAEWERKFRWLLDGWKFVPGGRILAAAGTQQQLTYYNCMPPEQEILTANGYKPIGDVQVGELVVTHRNRLRRVIHRFERETKEPLYIIRPKEVGYDALRVTAEHKVLAIRAESLYHHPSRDGWLRPGKAAEWIPAAELKPSDYVALAHDAEVKPMTTLRISEHLSGYVIDESKIRKPLVRSSRHGYLEAGGTHHDVNDEVKVDEDLCYLFGRWLGDGCIVHRTRTNIEAGIKIVFNLKERDESKRVARIVTEKFGVPCDIKDSSSGRWVDLWVNSMPVGQFFKAFLGCYAHSKRIPPELMHLPERETKALLKGLFRADGYISGNQIGILLSNRTLATQVHQLLLRLGYVFSIKNNTHRLGRWPAYRIQATANEAASLFEEIFEVTAPTGENDQKYYVEYDGLRWVRVDQIEVEEYEGPVIDLEVEEDHSFVSAGIVVSNCYVIPSPKDSRRGIVETLSQMMEVMSRGGGVGINVSSLRPRHSYVRGVNGRSSGAVSWGALYSFVTGLIEQGGSRRGALMLILHVWHPDVQEFITSKREMGKITNANISVGITDDFMQAVEQDQDWNLVFPDTTDPEYNELWDGDLHKWRERGKPVIVHKTVRARDLWNAVIESAWASAEPGVFFVDRYNKMSNSWYYAPILCTNPCITGDTLVATENGLERIDDLVRKSGVRITLDERLSPDQRFAPMAGVFLTGVKPVYRLRTKEGYTVHLTRDHRVFTERGWVRAQELVPGDRIHIHQGGGGFGRYGSRELGEVLGWLIGDGTLKADEAILSFLGEEKRELAPAFAEKVETIVAGMEKRKRRYTVGVVEVTGRHEARVGGQRLWHVANEYGLVDKKLRVPERLFTASREMQAGFLAALFTADGQVNDGRGHGCSVRLSSKSEALLLDVQRLLLNFGIVSRLYRNRKPNQMTAMPDGKGGGALYHTSAYHELVISKDNLVRFSENVGFLTRRKQDALEACLDRCMRGPYREDYLATFESLEYQGEEEVYDLTEPLTHSFVANGIVVHNCGEQGLPAWGVCNLGAINLSQFVSNGDVKWDELRATVRSAVRFLDNVIDATPYFFAENKQQQLSERRVGLGTMGLAEMLIRLKLRYGNDEALQFIDKLYHFIATEAYLASCDLAVEKGAFERFDPERFLESGFMKGMPEEVRQAVRDKGIRNVTLLTQAPTGTTGTMVGTSTGIEPFYFWTYYRKSRLGIHEETVRILEEWRQEHPNEPLPSYFVTAMDLAPEDHIRVEAAIQRWTDSSISKTCNVPAHYTVEQTRRLYELMYRLGCKGGTVYRDKSRDEQVLHLKESAQADASEPTVTVESPPQVRPRPYKRRGITVSKLTPAGTAHITMNDDDQGNPFEVFIEIGKAGSDLKAMAEAMGRLISLILRLASPVKPIERVREIVNQIRGIGGARAFGFGKDRVLSLPDAVGQALEENYGVKAVENFHPPAVNSTPTSEPRPDATLHADLCPSCGNATFVHQEGCTTCMTCGYSEC